MKLQISSYNNTGATWNAEAEETSLLSYKLRHRFNTPAEAICTIADTTGTKAQKYNVDGDDVYIGPGKATIEHPDATDIFYGRIVRAEADSLNRTVTLYCRDWLDQLNEERIAYDMREKLTGNERAGNIHTDPDNAKIHLRMPAGRSIYAAQADDGGAVTDETAAANEQTADDMTLLPAAPAVNDGYYFGFESKVSGFSLYISQQGDWTGSIVWYYWNGAAWSACVDFAPGDAASQNFEVAGQVDYSWTVQGDWGLKTINGIEAYYVFAKVVSYTGITTQPLGRDAWAEYFLYDDGIGWVADTYNNMYLMFEHGDDTVYIWPHDETVTPADAGMTSDVFNTDIEDLWNENANGHYMSNDDNWTVDYKLRPLVQDSSFFVSMSTLEISIKYYLTGTGSAVLQVYDFTAAGYVTLGDLPLTSGTVPEYKTFRLPDEYLDDFTDSDGCSIIRISVTRTAGTVVLKNFHLRQAMSVVYAIGTNKVTISDTDTNRLFLAEDISIHDGSWGLWEGMKYCITQPIYKHIDSGEVGTLVSDGDTLVQLTHAATIEHTSGIIARQYIDRTRLEILQDLADIDKAVFWIPLGGTTLTWKSTFNNGAPTAMTDASVEGWRSVFDYETMINEYNVYGARVGDTQVFQNANDATSQAKYGAIRTKALRNSGLVTQRDAYQLGTNVVARDANVQQMLSCKIMGLDSTFRLGTEVSITSTYLGLTTSNYIVYEWAYDSESNTTNLVLHPRVSQTGLMATNDIRDKFNDVATQTKVARNEQYIPTPITDEIA